MIKQDYILRLINELIRFLIDLLFYSKKITENETIKLSSQIYDILDIDEKLLSLNKDDIINHFEQTELGLSKLELLSYFLLEKSRNNQNFQESDFQKKKSIDLLQYVDENSDCFSFERKNILSQLQ